MWLLDYVTRNSILNPKTQQGSITGVNDGTVQVNASSDFRRLPIVAPYGIAYVPPAGVDSVVMPVGSGQVCTGVVAENKGLQPGELMLYSSGGASIVLKNDGSIYLNGVKYN